jgi:hypothetical protein
VSYQVQLKPRLEDIKAYSVPKECSSCFRRPAPQRRLLTAQIQVGRRTRVEWMIHLPLCEPCHEMYQVLYHYLPSRHGPPDRRRGNRRATLALMILVLGAIAGLILPESLAPWLTGLNRFGVVFVIGLAVVGLYHWNSRASQRARSALYRGMVEEAGYEFGDAEFRNVEPPRGIFGKRGEEQGPILVFENEAFGRTFEKANLDLLSTT